VSRRPIPTGRYPAEVFTVLRGLITDAAPAVLDVGCGTGDIARRLSPLVERVDAVDVSAAMIEHGRRQAGGDACVQRQGPNGDAACRWLAHLLANPPSAEISSLSPIRPRRAL
jgi:SAM-dependent methyltransferase